MTITLGRYIHNRGRRDVFLPSYELSREEFLALRGEERWSAIYCALDGIPAILWAQFYPQTGLSPLDPKYGLTVALHAAEAAPVRADARPMPVGATTLWPVRAPLQTELPEPGDSVLFRLASPEEANEWARLDALADARLAA